MTEQDLVDEILKAGWQAVYVCAGAGSRALADLLGVPGASTTMLECVVPYSSQSFDEFLGHTPSSYVSEKSAMQLAGRALTRARQLSSKREVGVACTASIQTNWQKRGEHEAYVATWTNSQIAVWHLRLEKGARTRVEEEAVVSRVVLNAIASAQGVQKRLFVDLTESDSLESYHYDVGDHVSGLYSGQSNFVGVYDFGRIRTSGINPQVLLPGSFNPLHEGHIGLATAASAYLDKPVAFEISAFNVDKPPLSQETARCRLAQFAGRFPVYLTSAPTFLEKAELFPDTTFVVGIDTVRRIVDPRYYQDSHEAMLTALRKLNELSCRFLVASRIDSVGKLHSLATIELPNSFLEMFMQLPEFRSDISSTEIRQRGGRAAR